MVVVTGAVQVGWHDAMVIGAILAVVAFANLDAGDLGDGIRLVRWLQWAGEQGGLAHGLGDRFGVNAA